MNIFYILRFLVILIFLFYNVIEDLKTRQVRNYLIKYLLFISLLIDILEFLFTFNTFWLYLISKINLIAATFILSYILYQLKIIGGGDAKVMIIIFLILPAPFINLKSIFAFFTFFSFFFLFRFTLASLFNFMSNNKESFQFFFNLGKIYSKQKRFYIYSFYRFLDFDQLSPNHCKYELTTTFLVYNFERRAFQIMIKYRSPVMIEILLAFLILLLMVI